MPIRPAHPNEASRLSAIAVEAKAYWGYAPEQIERWGNELIVTATNIAATPTFVAELDDEIVGFYSIVPSSQFWRLDNLWVAPAFMRRGIGRALFEHAVATALRGGSKGIAIDADPNAESFYLACGARRTGTIPAPIPGQPNRIRPQLLFEA